MSSRARIESIYRPNSVRTTGSRSLRVDGLNVYRIWPNLKKYNDSARCLEHGLCFFSLLDVRKMVWWGFIEPHKATAA